MLLNRILSKKLPQCTVLSLEIYRLSFRLIVAEYLQSLCLFFFIKKYLKNNGEVDDVMEESSAHFDVQVLRVIEGQRHFARVFHWLSRKCLVVTVQEAK